MSQPYMPRHFSVMKAAKQMRRASVSFRLAAIATTRHAVTIPRGATRSRFAGAASSTTLPWRPVRKQGGLSLKRLRAWHAQRGTLQQFYAMYPDEAPRR